MGRFYRRFEAPSSNPLLNLAVYLGIGAKLVVSLAITALTRNYVRTASPASTGASHRPGCSA